MRNAISVVVALILVIASGVPSYGEDFPKSARFRKLLAQSNGSFSLSDGVTTSRMANGKHQSIRVHETDQSGTFSFASMFWLQGGRGCGGGIWGGGWSLNGFWADANNNDRCVVGLRVLRRLLFYRDLLQRESDNDLLTKGHRPGCHMAITLGSVQEGEAFRMPDNTEWKAIAIETTGDSKGQVIFEAKAIPGTLDASLKNSKNNILILPLNSTVSLSVPYGFGPGRKESVSCRLSTNTRDLPRDETIKLRTKGVSWVKDSKVRNVYSKEENPNIKSGQTIELLPGRWCKIRKIVKPDPKKKIRGWIEFDTRPVAMKK